MHDTKKRTTVTTTVERGVSGIVAGVRAVVARVRASTWTRLAGRAFLLVVGLLVLAGIGRVSSAPAAMLPPASLDASAPPAFALVVPDASPPTPAPPAPPPAAGRGRATAEDPVFLNHAGVEELRRLPGVGPKRAEAIVALRQRMGRFQRVEDLLRVKGIGRTTLRRWRPLLRLDAPDAGPS